LLPPEPVQTSKYPSHFMVPFNRVYSTPNLNLPTNSEQQQQQQPVNSGQQINNSRDPRLARTKCEPISTSSETIPLSPQQQSSIERSLSDNSIRVKTQSNGLTLITKTSSMIYIPLNSSVLLADPRLKTLKTTRVLCYLELQAVKHTIQQQKRLNHYCESKNSVIAKTIYSPIPFIRREVTQEEFERLLTEQTWKLTKHSNGSDFPPVYISVTDCYHFGFLHSSSDNNSMCIDLEKSDNRRAYEQLEISNDLIQREQQLKSQQMRLHLREKRQQRRIQQQNQFTLPNSKMYVTKGRQLLKEHQLTNSIENHYLSMNFIDFFSREYRNETRPYIKHLLAEVVGVLLEKYEIKQDEINNDCTQNLPEDKSIDTVIDMDLASPISADLGDHDERFPTNPSPPPELPSVPQATTMESASKLIFTQTLSNESKTILSDENYLNGCQKIIEQLKEYNSKTDMQSDDTTEQLEFVSTSSLTTADIEEEDDDDQNKSLNEFVKLLTKEASISKSSSPATKLDANRRSSDSIRHRRRSHDNHDDTRKSIYSTHCSHISSRNNR